MKFRRFIRQVHRWLGLLVAAQLLLWVIGGLVMSVLRLEEVRGEDRIAARPAEALAAEGLLAPAQVIAAQAAPVSALALVMLDGRPAYRLEAGAAPLLVDARTGAQLSPLPRELAERIARGDYAGPAEVAGVDWVDVPGIEYRERALPLWRVRFADDRATALYVSPATGEVVARRNDLWRLFDFVWMFHIMDYEGREDFNHPLLIATAASALLFLITGLVMLVIAFRKSAAGTA